MRFSQQALAKAAENRRWVDFMEIFAGRGRLTAGVSQAGFSVHQGVDQFAVGRVPWDLGALRDQRLCYRLIREFSPLWIHVGLPCTHMCVLGKPPPAQSSEYLQNESIVKFTLNLTRLQQARGGVVSIAPPLASCFWSPLVVRARI